MIDERLVGRDDPDSNFRLIEAGLKDVVPAANLHPFIFYPQHSDYGVEAYIDELERYGGEYDMIVVSVGEDGHIGGLFPGHSGIAADDPFFITFTDSPKPPSGRISSSKILLQTASSALVLFNGETKAEAYQRFKNPKIVINDCPAKLVDFIQRVHIITNFSK
jgi:6-phosphogluconolactonase